MCLGGKPGLGELSESLATVAGCISSPGNVPLPAQPFPNPPRGCVNLPQLCGTTCVVASELVRTIFSSWRSLSQVVVAVKAIPAACREKGKNQGLLFLGGIIPAPAPGPACPSATLILSWQDPTAPKSQLR